MKICFLSLNSYPLLMGKNSGYIGGAEVEQVQLGIELSAHGHEICFVTYSDGPEQTESVSGIKVIKAYDRNKTGEIDRFSKLATICYSLKKANCDLYFHEAGATGVLPLFCFVNMKRFVHRIASDAVVQSKPLNGKHSFPENLSRLMEIRTADAVIAQSHFQQRILRERFMVESVIIKNGLLLPDAECVKPEPAVVLWVGSLSEVKAPKLFIEGSKITPKRKI